MAEKDYVQIKPDIFLGGMYPDTDVFYVLKGRPVLLCHSAVINDELLARIKEIDAMHVKMYVQKGTYDKLMRQYDYISATNNEASQNYRRVKNECRYFIDDVKKKNLIDQKEVQRLIYLSEESLNIMDPSMILSLANFMRDMDDQLQAHSVNVGILNGVIGKWLELPQEEIEKLVAIGLMHDLGKLRISDKIWSKPGKLTAEEFETVKKHPVYSYELMKRSNITDETLLLGVREHHERINGRGYPDGLNTGQISYYARITALSDVFDAMVSKRSYKAAQTPLTVLDMFYRDQFSELDMDLVNLFIDKMLTALNGRHVILTDGNMGIIKYIDKKHIAFPIVNVNGEAVQTDKELQVVSVCNDIFTPMTL